MSDIPPVHPLQAAAPDTLNASANEIAGQFKHDDLWGEKDSAEQRFGSVIGQMRWQVIQVVYLQDKSKHLMLFGPDGRKLLQRSPQNQRGANSAVIAYKGMFLKHGMMNAMRNTMIARPATMESTIDYVIDSGGTVIEAIYRAIESFPDNLFCKIVLRDGTCHSAKAWKVQQHREMHSQT